MTFNKRFNNLEVFQYSYCFIFYTNSHKTNLPVKELINLIIRQLPNIYLVYDYRSFRPESATDFILNTLVVIPNHNSCIISLNTKLNLVDIINQSGYVQSCGELLYISPWYDLNKDSITASLEEFCQKDDSKSKVVFYSKEDFGEKTRSSEGIDDIKFYKKKYFIGDKTVFEYMIELQKNIKFQNTIIERISPDDKDRYDDYPFTECVFVIKDIDLIAGQSKSYNQPEYESQLFIIYTSRYKKENPIHIIDENKPYWPGAYTTPQTLVNSLFSFVSATTRLIVDPFGGSGGIAIAAKNRFEHVIISDMTGSDGIKHNIDFFSDQNMRNEIFTFLKNQIRNYNINIPFDKRFDQYSETFKNILHHDDFHWNESLDLFIKNYIPSNIEKFIYFTTYKILFNDKIVSKETIFGELSRLEYIYERGFKSLFKCVDQDDEFLPIPAKYGRLITGKTKVNQNLMVLDLPVQSLFNDDIYNQLIRNQDEIAIVSDPPYGFNTVVDDNSDEDLKRLYNDFFDFALQSISATGKKRGNIIICCLRNVKIGKKIYPSSISVNIERQFYAKLREHNYKIFDSTVLFEFGDWWDKNIFWKSEKSLDREILSYYVEKE